MDTNYNRNVAIESLGLSQRGLHNQSDASQIIIGFYVLSF